jgi:hypothetical protein
MIIAGLPAASIYPGATGYGNAGSTLPAGTYYLAVGPAHTNFQPDFNVNSSIDLRLPLIGQNLIEISGDHRVNITFSVIPEPASLCAWLALATAALRRPNRPRLTLPSERVGHRPATVSACG